MDRAVAGTARGIGNPSQVYREQDGKRICKLSEPLQPCRGVPKWMRTKERHVTACWQESYIIPRQMDAQHEPSTTVDTKLADVLVRISNLNSRIDFSISISRARSLHACPGFSWNGQRDVELASCLIKTHAFQPSHQRTTTVWHTLLSKCRHLRSEAYQQASAKAVLPRCGVPARIPTCSWSAKT